MKIIKTKFKGLLIFKQNNYMDKRGNLRVTYNKKQFKKISFMNIALSQKKMFYGVFIFKLNLYNQNL